MQGVIAKRALVIAGVTLGFVAGWAIINPALAQSKGNLVVKVAGLNTPQGRICLKVFSGSQGFPYQHVGGNGLAAKCVAIAQNPQTVTFNSLVPGHYAIAAFHDRNSDSKLNQGNFGMPLEGFGFSNNPPLRFGPASFNESKFQVSGVQTIINIQMRYLQ